MARWSATLLILCAIAAFPGCSSGISYRHDWDRDEDMTKYGTFDWLPVPPRVSGDLRTARERNLLLEKRIKRAVNAQLEARGFVQDTLQPSFRIAYHAGSEERVSVTDWGYRYGPGPWGYYGRDFDVRQYTRGTLILDFIDASTNELFWRGEASKTINPNARPEDIDRTINEAVAGLLEKWPPKEE
jgi:hypothetical protein